MVKFPTHQRLFKNFPIHQTIYSYPTNINILLLKHNQNILNLQKLSYGVLFISRQWIQWQWHMNLVCICWMQKGLLHPFACDADQCFEIKVNAQLGGPHFGSNSPLYGEKRQPNIQGIRSFGIDWYIVTQNHLSFKRHDKDDVQNIQWLRVQVTSVVAKISILI